MSYPQFEFRSENPGGRKRAAPVGVAAFYRSRPGHHDWYRRGNRSYAAGDDSAAESSEGNAEFGVDEEHGDIFGWAVSVEMQHTGILVSKQMLKAVIEHALAESLETGGVRFWAPRRMIDGDEALGLTAPGEWHTVAFGRHMSTL